MQLQSSPSQSEWLALIAIGDHLRRTPLAPTLDELAAELGLTTFVVQAHLRRLKQLGLVTFHRTTRGSIATRSIHLSPRGQAALEIYRPLQNTNLLRGTSELALTRRQMEQARAAELPVDAFPQFLHHGKIILQCFDWQERNFWGEKILRVLV